MAARTYAPGRHQPDATVVDSRTTQDCRVVDLVIGHDDCFPIVETLIDDAANCSCDGNFSAECRYDDGNCWHRSRIRQPIHWTARLPRPRKPMCARCYRSERARTYPTRSLRRTTLSPSA